MTQLRPIAYIHPTFLYDHYTFFLTGLELAGYEIRYRSFSAPDLAQAGGAMAVIVDDRRIIVSANDQSDVSIDHLTWADTYGKVNLDWANVPPNERSKVVALGPSFGVQRPGFLLEYARIRRAGGQQVNLWRSWQRTVLSAYHPRPSSSNYIFFAAWPWSKHPSVNPARRKFVEEARRVPGVRFEGGFSPYRFRRPAPGFEDVTAPRRYDHKTYLRNMSRSAVAFNTPAVHNCLGWKLGEFLALGKAILSLPLSRELPCPLIHGTHIHVVESVDEIADGIRTLVRDAGYRRHLEINAHEWYQRWLRPDQVIRRMIPDAETV